jgi:uncharacterized membrane protein
VAVAIEGTHARAIHPLHAVFLAGALPPFLGATLSDAAYASTFEIQWLNFAAWLLVGGLLFSGVALLFALADLRRVGLRIRGAYVVALLATWIVGFFDALMHARDAWASMPAGLVLSVIATLLACLAIGLGFVTLRGQRP